MAFWNHVCYVFPANSLEFSFWRCWLNFHFLYVWARAKPKLIRWWKLILSKPNFSAFSYNGRARDDNEPSIYCALLQYQKNKKWVGWEENRKETPTAGLAAGLWADKAERQKPSSAATKMATTCKEIPHHKMLLRFTVIPSRNFTFCQEQDASM